MPDNRQFNQHIYSLIAAIPVGRVATYGQLAFMAGRPRAARQAGRALHHAPDGLPCHRVVNSVGRTAPGWAQQRELLAAEGIIFRPNGYVDMRKHLWRPA